MTASSRHQKQIEEHLECWGRKPALRDVYGDLYRLIAAHVSSGLDGEIIEIGSGIRLSKG